MRYAEPQEVRYAEPQEVRYAEPQEVRYAEPQEVRYAEPQEVRYAEPQEVAIDAPPRRDAARTEAQQWLPVRPLRSGFQVSVSWVCPSTDTLFVKHV